MISSELMPDAPLRILILTINPNFHHFYMNNAPSTAGSKRAAYNKSCLNSVISYVLNADSGR